MRGKQWLPGRRRRAVEVGHIAVALQDQLEQAVDTAVARRNEGAEDAAVSETVIAVRTAQALERLTGASWDDTLEAQSERYQP